MRLPFDACQAMVGEKMVVHCTWKAPALVGQSSSGPAPFVTKVRAGLGDPRGFNNLISLAVPDSFVGAAQTRVLASLIAPSH
jgi:hypothetical protein